MFNRASNRAYVCLRCQHRLTFRSSRREAADFSRGFVRRWQSTGVARASEEPEEGQDGDESISFTRYSSNGSRDRTKFRHWTPAPTADLGVERLGQPADILILPQGGSKRQRRKDLEVEDPGNTVEAEPVPEQSGSSMSVRQALAQESRPASPSQLIENIEELRLQVGSPSDPVDKDALAKYCNLLTSGFSKAQLKRYVVVKMGRAGKEGIQGASKRDLAEFIMSRVWGFPSDLPSEDIFTMDKGKFHLMLSSGAFEQLFCTFPMVTCEFLPRDAGPRLRMTGDTAGIESLKSILGGKATAKSIPMSDACRAALAQGAEIERSMGRAPTFERDLRNPQSLAYQYRALRKLIDKHAVVPTSGTPKKEQDLMFNALSDASFVAFERELTLLQASFITSSQRGEEKLTMVDDYLTVPVYRGPVNSSSAKWHRYVKKNVSGSEGNILQRMTAAFDEAQDTIPSAPTSHRNNLHVYDPSTRIQEHSVQFGQVLYRYHDDVNDDKDSSVPKSAFVSIVPFLPQFLSTVQPLVSAVSTPIQSALTDNDRLLRILYQAADPILHPTVQIYATTSSESALSIKEVSLLMPEAHTKENILQPASTIDLRYCRRDKILLTQPDLKIIPKYAPFLAAIATGLIEPGQEPDVDAPRLDVPDLNPLLDLDITSLLQTGRLKSTVVQGQVSSSEKPQKEAHQRKKNVRDDGPVRYALQKVERIEQRIYHVPGASNDQLVYLEHLISRRPGKLNDGNTKQALRLVEMPLLCYLTPESSKNFLIGRDPERFKLFAMSACGTAKQLDRYIQATTEEMVKLRAPAE